MIALFWDQTYTTQETFRTPINIQNITKHDKDNFKSQCDHREQWTIRRSTVDIAAYYSGFAFPANKYNLISLKMSTV